jgi:uncharacterized membrane protein YphA (DoxX/SURF4 family)
MRTWLGLLGRILLAGVWLYAGGAKASDLAASVRAVHAYDILPYGASKVVGAALPFVELALGLLLFAGFATRLAAGVSAGLLVLFIGGISAAWARGLQIDCGCFGGGGALAEGRSPTYFWELLRDAALLAVAGYLLWRPRSRLAVDNFLADNELPAENEEPDEPHDEAPASDEAASQGSRAAREAGPGAGPPA